MLKEQRGGEGDKTQCSHPLTQLNVRIAGDNEEAKMCLTAVLILKDQLYSCN